MPQKGREERSVVYQTDDSRSRNLETTEIGSECEPALKADRRLGTAFFMCQICTAVIPLPALASQNGTDEGNTRAVLMIRPLQIRGGSWHKS